MPKELLTMSGQELDRLAIIKQIELKQLSQKMASQQLMLSARQVRRLQKRYENQGTAGLISARRGRQSNNHIDAQERQRIADIIRTTYGDFGPTLAHEKLALHHQCDCSRESIRSNMIEHGLWKGRARKATVTVCDNKGDITLLYKGKSLPYKRFTKNNRPTPIIDTKSIDKQIYAKPNKPATNHPWRSAYKVA